MECATYRGYFELATGVRMDEFFHQTLDESGLTHSPSNFPTMTEGLGGMYGDTDGESRSLVPSEDVNTHVPPFCSEKSPSGLDERTSEFDLDLSILDQYNIGVLPSEEDLMLCLGGEEKTTPHFACHPGPGDNGGGNMGIPSQVPTAMSTIPSSIGYVQSDGMFRGQFDQYCQPIDLQGLWRPCIVWPDPGHQLGVPTIVAGQPTAPPAARKSSTSMKATSLKKNFRGVSRHKLTQRWEASLWLNGRQLYLGGFNLQQDAAKAYDLAALACKGKRAVTNFPTEMYKDQLQEMQGYTEEEVVAYIRRRSTAFSRGRSKYRGVSGQAGRWEARIGSFGGRKNVSFGVFDTEVEAARQYDRALIVEKGRSAKTNFPLKEYEVEAIQYQVERQQCTSRRDLEEFKELYTLPRGREVTADERKRAVYITGEALLVALQINESDILTELRLRHPSGQDGRPILLAELKRLVAQELLQSSGTRSGVGAERVRFIAGGKEIQTDEALRQVDTNVKILCLLKPKGPCKDLLEIGKEEQVEEDNVDSLFMFAPWVPPACKAFCARFKIPEWVVAPLTRVKRKHWVLLTLWLITSHMLSRYDLGPVFILGTLFFLMFSNLGTRTGEYSAYSIFNRGVRRLPGQLTAEDLNRQMRPQ